MAIHRTAFKRTDGLAEYMDAEGFIPTRTTDTAEDWGFDRDSREWMLYVKAATEAVKALRRNCAV